MRIQAISFLNTKNKQSNVNFRGISTNSNEYGEINNTDIFASNDADDASVFLSKYFEKGFKAIKEKYAHERNELFGLFKNRRLQEINKSEDNQISGFLIAQNLKVEERQKYVSLLEDYVKELQKHNSTRKELLKAENALKTAQKTLEISKYVASSKDSLFGFDAIAGYDFEKAILTDHFISLIPKEQAGMDVKIPNGILFFGPYGNGKTSFASAFAQSAGCDDIEIAKAGPAQNQYAKQENLYNDIINKAQDSQKKFLATGKRTIILVDEIERLTDNNPQIVCKMKRFLESCSQKYHCTIFATTNNPLELPEELISSKRMPIKVSIDPPNEINSALILKHYLKIHFPNLDLKSVNLENASQKISEVRPDKYYNASDIEDIVKEYSQECSTFNQSDFEKKISTKEPSLKKEDIDKYEKEKEELIGEFYD